MRDIFDVFDASGSESFAEARDLRLQLGEELSDLERHDRPTGRDFPGRVAMLAVDALAPTPNVVVLRRGARIDDPATVPAAPLALEVRPAFGHCTCTLWMPSRK